jgi:hypothetical protein
MASDLDPTIATLIRERDALAAAVEVARDEFRQCADDTTGTSTSGYFGKLAEWMGDPASILAARDARMKRQGAIEELNDFLAVGRDDYLGPLTMLGIEIRRRIAALEKEIEG